MIQNNIPQTTQVERLEKKELGMYIYVGKPNSLYEETYGTEPKIQLNDKIN